MNITLYRAAHDLKELLDQVDPDTGEFPEGMESARAIVATKGASVAAYILNTEAMLAAVTARAKELQEQAKRHARRVEWLRQYLAENMAETGVLQISGGDFTAKLERERDASVEVFQPELLPLDYMREIPARQEPDKTLIKKSIADGFDVPGARIIKRDRLILK